MKRLITDDELMRYAEGVMDSTELRALQRRAIDSRQTDLLLAACVAACGAERDEAAEYWGAEAAMSVWQTDSDDLLTGRIAAYKDGPWLEACCKSYEHDIIPDISDDTSDNQFADTTGSPVQ